MRARLWEWLRGLLLGFYIAGFTVLIMILTVVFWTWLNAYVDPSSAQEKSDLVRILVQTLGGVIVLLGLYFTWRRVTAAEKTVAISLEGQITERFTRAIDHLGATDDAGNKKLEIRLGGIYGLQQIAQDSDKFYWQIMEVLTAYIRMNAPVRPSLPPLAPPPKRLLLHLRELASKLRSFNASALMRQKRQEELRPTTARIIRRRPPRPPADIEGALLALAHRKYSYGAGEDRILDLRRTDLRGANLSNFNFNGAWFDHSRLDGATLSGGQFIGADFSSCHLEGVSLGQCHLEDADFSHAHLEGVWLGGAHLEGAFFYRSHLEGASLYQAHLKGADFDSAHLEGAKFGKPSNWMASGPEGANLEGAFFGRAHLRGTSFEKVDLTGADFRWADLREAKGLTRAQLEKAITDETTRLPMGLRFDTN